MTVASSYRGFAILSIASLAIWWPTISATLALALHRDAYTHILLTLPVSVALILMSWRRHNWEPTLDLRSGVVLLSLASLVGLSALRCGRCDILTGDIRLALEALALVTWWMGSFVGCFGNRIARACIFPLLFLLWLVPAPEFLLHRVEFFLQTGTASLARLLLECAGVPVARDGTTLVVPGLTLQIAQECSSIRSSTLLVVISVLLSHLFLRSTWARLLVVLVSLPLSIAKNGVRIFTLAVLGAYLDRGILNSPLHHQGGILFLALALATVVILTSLLARLEARASAHQFPDPSAEVISARQ